MTAKEKIYSLLEELPDDCTLEDFEYHLFVRRKLEHSIAQADKGEVISQAEIEQKSRGWLRQ